MQTETIKRLTLLFVVAIVDIHADRLTRVENITTSHSNASRTGDVLAQTKLADLWNMVASMNQNSGSSRVDYERNDVRIDKRFDWNINLDRFGNYRLNWRVDYANNLIFFGLELSLSEKSNFQPGSGIFGLGFSQYGELSSSDYCLIWYDLSHRIHLQDARTNASNILELEDESESACQLIRSRVEHNGGADLPSTDNDYGGPSLDEDEAKREKVVILFKRPLEVCSTNWGPRYYRIDNGTTHLVWFSLVGPVLSIDGLNITELIESSSQGAGKRPAKSNATKHHEQDDISGLENFEFGLSRVQLVATKSKVDPNTIKSHTRVDIRMEKYQVPAQETTYWCKLFKLPKKFQSKRYHITSYEAVIEPGNEHIVHHMELFNCANLTPEQASALDQLHAGDGGWSGDCSGPTRPPATDPCRRVILAWAMGARPLVYPEQVGQSIGGAHYSPYVVLEVHYNNVLGASGLIDSSGLRFHYSSKLRPYDAGVLEVGLEYTDKNSIPPGMLVPLAGYCVSECTRLAISSHENSVEHHSSRDNGDYNCQHPDGSNGHTRLQPPHRHGDHHRDRGHCGQDHDQVGGKNQSSASEGDNNHLEGIYVFAAQMHTHLTGVASWTEHIRGGKWLGELQRDNHYSPHFQEIRLLPEPVHLLPGDALIHYCLYDTRRRQNITLGGFATSDEMCVTYLHYYPKIDLEVCKSSVDTRALERYFAYLATDESQETSKHLSELQQQQELSNYSRPPSSSSSSNTTHEGVSLSSTSSSTTILTPINTASGQLKSVSENYRAIEWSPRRSRELMEFYANAPLSVQCNRSNGQRWPGPWAGLEPTRLEASASPGGPNDLEITSGQRDNRASRAQPPYAAPKWSDGLQLVGYRGRGSEAPVGEAGAGGRHAHCRRPGATTNQPDRRHHRRWPSG